MQAIYHNLRDSKGRFASKGTKAKAGTAKTLVNLVAYVIDSSGSMSGCWSTALKVLNDQLAEHKDQANKYSQYTKLSLINFSNNIQIEFLDAPSDSIINNYYVKFIGMGTALNDAIQEAINNLRNSGQVYDRKLHNVSYSVNIITDGQENASRIPTSKISDLISSLQAEGNWSFIMNCPFGSKNTINKQYGIPLGNINEWENTTYGTQTMGTVNIAGTQSYYATRSTGATSVNNFFDVNANNFAVKNLSNLRQISPKHRKVEAEGRIDEFFTGKGQPYLIGMGFYELTKTEKIQDYKKLVILDVNTGNYYTDGAGFSVREFLGMPKMGTTRVNPKNVGSYRIYVQSTSDNRILVRGTTVLWGV